MSMNGRKLNRYLGELDSIYQESVNLAVNYTNAVNAIAQVRNDTREIGLDRNYINITEQQLYQHHQLLSLQLNALNLRLNGFKTRPLTLDDHVHILVLGEELANWSDIYTANVVTPAINVMMHIQNVYSQLPSFQGA